MIVGTHSMERRGDDQRLSSADRRKSIIDAVRRFAPDLLVCAGHSVAKEKDVYRLAENKLIKDSSSYIVLESERSAKVGLGQSSHCLFVIKPGGTVKRLGRQVFAKSSDVAGSSAASRKNLEDLARILPNRTFKAFGHSIVVLCCGEINVLKGRNNVKCLSNDCEAALMNADLVINPTHDRMGNAGTLDKKRKFLSKKIGTRTRAYISSSNWNSRPKEPRPRQNPDADTLHTVYVSGRKISRIFRRPVAEPRYEYRQTTVKL